MQINISDEMRELLAGAVLYRLVALKRGNTDQEAIAAHQAAWDFFCELDSPEEEFCDCVFTGDVADASQCALHKSPNRRDNSEFVAMDSSADIFAPECPDSPDGKHHAALIGSHEDSLYLPAEPCHYCGEEPEDCANASF